MSKFRPRQLHLRGLVADVLPFELPITFTNDFFFASTLPLRCLPQTAHSLALLRKPGHYTIPYDYNITKDRGRTTQLSIVHPIAQIRMAKLIDDYAETMLSYCAKSSFSLRYPSSIVSLYSGAPLDPEATARDGLPHDLLEDGAPDFSRMSSFFRLNRYNVLSKFVDSNEYIELEKRFSKLMTLDVSKCFYNIYSHSLSWAVKGKDFTKSHLQAYSFEAAFDAVMQFSNYKETNGIVVGPELSRIYAEIIFQQIDKELVVRLLQAHRLTDGDYTVRRYVDDYHIFSNDANMLDTIERELAALLAKYKLYLNTDKRKVRERPFVTAISRMKHSVAVIIDEVAKDIRVLSNPGGAVCDRAAADDLRSRLRNIRLVMNSDDVGFHNISGWLMWKLRRMLRESLKILSQAVDDDHKDSAAKVVASVFEVAFYVTALDFRVRTGFNLALLLDTLQSSLRHSVTEQAEWLSNYVFEELISLTESVNRKSEVISIELSNLLIMGAHSYQSRYVRSSAARRALAAVSKDKRSYIAYITLKFCYLKDSAFYGVQLDELNSEYIEVIRQEYSKLPVDTSLYLLFCDMISCPDLDIDRKKGLLDLALAEDIAAGRIGRATDDVVGELTRLIGFVDWSGIRLHHTLVRRQLRKGREY